MLDELDLLVVTLGSRQCGLFARWQLLDEAKTDSDRRRVRDRVHRRTAAARWENPAAGVYAMPGHPDSYERRLWLALLAAGRGAMLSHESAAQRHWFRHMPRDLVCVTTRHGDHHRLAAFGRYYQSTRPAEPVVVDGFPVTPAARTIVDLGRCAGPKRLGDCLSDAAVRRRVRLTEVRRVFLELNHPQRPGMEVVEEVLKRLGNDYVPVRSELERELRSLLALAEGCAFSYEAALPGRDPLSGERVDAICHDPRLIAEGDGRAWHTRVKEFKRDRRRDRRALTAGYPTARYAWEELTDDREDTEVEFLELMQSLREGPPRK